MNLSSAGNTEIPAYLILRENGYSIERKESEGKETWMAIKGDTKLIGDSLLELLSLRDIIEQRGKNWKATDDEIEEFLRTYYPHQQRSYTTSRATKCR